MRGVVTLSVPIAQLRTLEAGETVGYDAQWTAKRRIRVATISAGYADGYPRAATATDAKREAGRPAGEAIIADVVARVGRVSMDLITVDVTDPSRRGVARGSRDPDRRGTPVTGRQADDRLRSSPVSAAATSGAISFDTGP